LNVFHIYHPDYLIDTHGAVVNHPYVADRLGKSGKLDGHCMVVVNLSICDYYDADFWGDGWI
jgi:hypothetical protein